MTILYVFGAAMVTAIFTGIGALPFLFIKKISPTLLGRANAIAAGLMLGASLGLLFEGWEINPLRLGIGMVLGFVLIYVARSFFDDHDEETDVAELGQSKLDTRKMLLIIGIMTVHSFAEGIGVGVSFGESQNFGNFISAAIAVHNIPEGLAIALVMVPRGTSVWRAGGWSIFSSLPQPLMAIPAFLFVLLFKPFLPIGLGLAAGAMIWMVFVEMLPEAQENISLPNVAGTAGLATFAMIAFQFVIG